MEGPRLACSKEVCVYTVVSRKYAPPFAILALVQNAGEGAYTWDATISLAITPSLPVKHNLIVNGKWGPSARRTDALDASGRLTNLSVERRRNMALPRSSGHVHR